MAKIAYGATVSNVRGKIGVTVYSAGRSGATARIRKSGSNPRTTAQQDVRRYFTTASETFKTMTSAQVADWDAYAQSLTLHNPVSGEAYHPAAINTFVALGSKFLQINPTGTLPMNPPTAPFRGDTITVTAENTADGITFTASGANALHVKTELLVQKLASPNRTPTNDAYRSQGFVAFASGSLTFALNLPGGAYGVAYRFVNALTGQETLLQVLPVIVVG